MSKVVFVGNVPYNMGEEHLIEVFKTVGQVVGFRLVFDRGTGRPRGYGFCEFSDHETAKSAVRNLNDVDVGGRPLRIDLADSDPNLEGKTTVRGELLDVSETLSQWHERERCELSGNRRSGPQEKNDPRAFLRALPPGVPLCPGMSSLDSISQNLASMNPRLMTEVLAQMKAFVISHPDRAKILFQEHPQLSYALIQCLLLCKIIDPIVLQRMLAMNQSPAHPSIGLGMAGGDTYTSTAMRKHILSYGEQRQAHAQPYPPQAVLPPPAPHQAHQEPLHFSVLSNLDPAQRDMVLQVLAFTPERIAELPAKDRDTVVEVRSRFLGMLNQG